MLPTLTPTKLPPEIVNEINDEATDKVTPTPTLPEKAAEAGIVIHKAVATGAATVTSFFRGLTLGR